MNTQDGIVLFIKGEIRKKAEKLQVVIDEEINESFSLTGSGFFDSMDFMRLIVEVEEKFGVEVNFSDHDPKVFTTVGGFIKCIE
jgi:acyl carrier protein